jgi:hypothetical protein
LISERERIRRGVIRRHYCVGIQAKTAQTQPQKIENKGFMFWHKNSNLLLKLKSMQMR